MWKRGQRLHKLETVDDYNNPVFYGHSREILHTNSQQLWQHAQGLVELKPEQSSNSEVTGALGISVLGVKLLEDGSYWEKSLFSKDVAPEKMTMLQTMATHGRVYRQQ